MLEVLHPKHKERRDAMRALGICINASYVMPRADGRFSTSPRKQRIEHGPVVKAGKCQRCLDVHKQSW